MLARNAQRAQGHGQQAARASEDDESAALDGAAAAAAAAGRTLDAVDRLLLKAKPLEGRWGTELFGLASVDVLGAIEVRARGEAQAPRLAGATSAASARLMLDHRPAAPQGLPHADECAAYVFVESRSSWEEEFRRLQRELAARGRPQAPQRPGFAQGGDDASQAPRPKRVRHTPAQSEANQIRRVLDAMIRQVRAGRRAPRPSEHPASQLLA